MLFLQYSHGSLTGLGAYALEKSHDDSEFLERREDLELSDLS